MSGQSALDRGALSSADLAYIGAQGSPAERCAMAIRAYLWALDNTEPHPLGTAYPSLNQWREEAARITAEGGPLLAPGVSVDDLLAAAEQRGREAGAAEAREQVAREIEAVDSVEWVLYGQDAGMEAARIARGDA